MMLLLLMLLDNLVAPKPCCFSCSYFLAIQLLHSHNASHSHAFQNVPLVHVFLDVPIACDLFHAPPLLLFLMLFKMFLLLMLLMLLLCVIFVMPLLVHGFYVMLLLLLLAIQSFQVMMFLLLMLLGSLVAPSCDAPLACDFCHALLAFVFM
jgi:hypothetical protein